LVLLLRPPPPRSLLSEAVAPVTAIATRIRSSTIPIATRHLR